MRHGLSAQDMPDASGGEWQSAWRLWPHVWRDRQRVVIAMALLLAAKVATLSTPWVLKSLVDGLSATAVAMSASLVWVGAYAGLRLLGTWLGEWRDLVFGRVTERAMRNVGVEVFSHLQSLDLDFHQSRQTGALSRDMERGINGIRFLLRFLLFNILPTLIEIIAVGVILIRGFGWAYGAVMLASVIAYVLWTVRVTEWRTKHVRASHQQDSSAHGRAVDALINYETVKYFNAEKREADVYDEQLAAWEQSMRSSRRSLALLNSGQALVIALSLLGILLLATRDVAAGQATVGDFVMINAYMLALFTPLNFLGFVYREIRASLVALHRLFALLDARPAITDRPGAGVWHPSDPPLLRFDDVHFAYRPDTPILRGVSFAVAPGTTTAIVGPSGAGKSTIAKLLFRFHDPDSGAIQVDGEDLRDIELASLRAQIGVVPQDAVLLNDTIAANIAYGRTGATTDEVRAAAHEAALEKFLERLPQGMATTVGERGVKVSGGERQRLAIARVLLKDPRILILDEATSSLDNASEATVLATLRTMMHTRTCVAIAHRLSTIRDADQIIVLENGLVAERGTHESLLALEGVYARLWRQQVLEDQTATSGTDDAASNQ